MGKHETDWRGACTLIDRVVYLNGRNETDSPEYQALLRFFGKEKLDRIWEEHRPKPKPDPRLPQERDDEVTLGLS